jgi:hypothetical protein
MSMPAGIGIVDTIIGFPAEVWPKFLRENARRVWDAAPS